MKITPGKRTGIFKNYSGFCDLYGVNAIGEIWFKLDGYVIYDNFEKVL